MDILREACQSIIEHGNSDQDRRLLKAKIEFIHRGLEDELQHPEKIREKGLSVQNNM